MSTTFSSSMGQAHNYRRWLADSFGPYLGRNLLEVGIGDGGFADLLPQGTRYTGLDIDPELVRLASRELPRHTFLEADVCDRSLTARLGAGAYDTVLCCNVLEHLEDDGLALGNMVDLLAVGGHLLLFVPALPALFNDLDRCAGHLRRYTLADLPARLPDPVQPLKLHYFNPLGGIGWWLNRWLRHDSLEGAKVERQVLFFDRFVLPLSRLLTPVTRRFFGQSLICVARKR